ncbi:MAG: hypothetical protein E7218_06440 [Anaerofustis stercorihominis]|nr:hypothetical protein [Anaerofustis stercorihominis]
MKKLVTLLLVVMLIFSFAACGRDEKDDEHKIDTQDIINKALDDAEEFDSFSEKAVEHYLKAYDISYDELKPEWAYTVGSTSAYADDPANGSGHAVVIFKTDDSSELTDEQIKEYFAQVFAATAKASDDGYNIIGYEFVGEGENPVAETTLEDALNSWLRGWGFRHNGKNMAVYVSDIYDNSKDSELDRLFYYYGVKFDIGVGLQKSFDETWDEMEDYFEENEDEIKNAIDDYIK